MSDAPERIWAVHGLDEILSFNTYNQGGTEYIRADVHATLQSQLDTAAEALEKIATYESLAPGVDAEDALATIKGEQT